MDLSNKVAVVTGAAGGIGYAIALRLAQAGASIAILDLQAEAAQSAAEKITQATNQKAIGISVDVSSEEGVISAVKHVVDQFGQLDILVNNAGIQIISPVAEFEFSAWKKVIDINLHGMFLMTKYCMQQMQKQQTGNIIYIGSVHSFQASLNKSAYVASKHATLGLMHAVAKEGAKDNIVANLVAPGFVRTPLVDKQIPEQAKQLNMTEEEIIKKVMLKDTVDGEFTTAEDVAEAVCFFAASKTKALTGQSLVVSHGWHMA